MDTTNREEEYDDYENSVGNSKIKFNRLAVSNTSTHTGSPKNPQLHRSTSSDPNIQLSAPSLTNLNNSRPASNEVDISINKVSKSILTTTKSSVGGGNEKLKLKIILNQPFYTGDSWLTGYVYINNLSKPSDGNLFINEISLELTGYEEVQNAINTSINAKNKEVKFTTKVFYRTRLLLQDALHPSACVNQNQQLDLEGYRPILLGLSKLPFSLKLAENLPNCLTTEVGKVGYVLELSVDIKSNIFKQKVGIKRPLLLFERWFPKEVSIYRNHQIQTEIKKSFKFNLTSATSSSLGLGSSKSGDKKNNNEILFKVASFSSLVTAGSLLYLKVEVINNSFKKFLGLKLALIRNIKVNYLEDSGTIDGSLGKLVEKSFTREVYSKFYKESEAKFLPYDTRDTLVALDIPANLLSLRYTALLKVDYSVQVSLLSSFSKNLVVALPIYISHPVSWNDPPPQYYQPTPYQDEQEELNLGSNEEDLPSPMNVDSKYATDFDYNESTGKVQPNNTENHFTNYPDTKQLFDLSTGDTTQLSRLNPIEQEIELEDEFDQQQESQNIYSQPLTSKSADSLQLNSKNYLDRGFRSTVQSVPEKQVKVESTKAKESKGVDSKGEGNVTLEGGSSKLVNPPTFFRSYRPQTQINKFTDDPKTSDVVNNRPKTEVDPSFQNEFQIYSRSWSTSKPTNQPHQQGRRTILPNNLQEPEIEKKLTRISETTELTSTPRPSTDIITNHTDVSKDSVIFEPEEPLQPNYSSMYRAVDLQRSNSIRRSTSTKSKVPSEPLIDLNQEPITVNYDTSLNSQFDSSFSPVWLDPTTDTQPVQLDNLELSDLSKVFESPYWYQTTTTTPHQTESNLTPTTTTITTSENIKQPTTNSIYKEWELQGTDIPTLHTPTTMITRSGLRNTISRRKTKSTASRKSRSSTSKSQRSSIKDKSELREATDEDKEVEQHVDDADVEIENSGTTENKISKDLAEVTTEATEVEVQQKPEVQVDLSTVTASLTDSITPTTTATTTKDDSKGEEKINVEQQLLLLQQQMQQLMLTITKQKEANHS